LDNKIKCFLFVSENWDEWQGNLDGSGECLVRTACLVHKIVFICDDGMPVISNDE